MQSIPHPDQLSLFPVDGKVCIKCGQLKAWDQFGIHTRSLGTTRNTCKACDSVKSAAYRGAHPGHNGLYKQKNAARQAATFRAWRLTNAVHNRERMAAWQKANPGKVHVLNVRRRLHVEMAGEPFTTKEWEALKVKFGYRCLMCGRMEPEIKLTFDHVVPVSKGGTNDIGNGQPLCQPCNTRKKDRTLDLR